MGDLQTQLGAATPDEVLTGAITLSELIDALRLIDGLEGLDALDDLSSLLAIIPAGDAEIVLSDLLQFNEGVDAYSDINLNVLDLVTGSIQLFNSENLLTTPTAITLNSAAVGLPGVGNVTLQAQVIEQPVFACGRTGTDFYAAAIRLKLGVELLNHDAQNPLTIGTGIVGVDLKLTHLDVYLDVASGSGLIQTIDAIQRAVTVQATPGLTDIYVGTLADADFFNSDPIDLADLTPGIVGSLTITVPGVLDFSPTAVTVPGVGIEAYALGTTAPQMLNFTGEPATSGLYPQTLTASAGTSVVTTYTTQLLTNLVIDPNLNATIDGLLDGLFGPLGGIIQGLLRTLLGLGFSDPLSTITDPILQSVTDTLLPSLLEPVLNLVLGDIADPLFDGLGIGLGEMDVTVLGLLANCPELSVDKSHVGSFAVGNTGQYTIQVTNTGFMTATAPITVVDTLPISLTYNSHTGIGWNVVLPTTGQTITFTHVPPLAPGAALPALILTVDLAPNVPEIVINSVVVTTTGNAGGALSLDTDLTTITGTGDDDGDGTPNGTDPDDDDPCVPNPNATNCDNDDDGTLVGNDPDDSNPCTPVAADTRCPELTINKSHVGDFATVTVGNYTIQVANTGQLATSSAITVVDTLPVGLTYNSHAGSGWSIVPPMTEQVLTFVNNGPLAPNAILPSLVLSVNVSTTTGAVINSVTATTFNNANGPNADTDLTIIEPSPDDDSDGSVGNDDPDDANPCVPSNTVAACDNDDDSSPQGNDPDDNNPCVPIDTIAACDSDNDGIPDGMDPDADDPCDPVATALQCPVLRIIKSHDGNFATATTGQYTIQISNMGGDNTVAPILVVDTLPIGLTYLNHSGTSWNLVGNTSGQSITFINSLQLQPEAELPPLLLTVSVADNAPGLVVNTVSVTSTNNAGKSLSLDADTTIITGSPDQDGDGYIGDDDPDDNDPCVPNNQVGVCDRDGDGLNNTEEELNNTNPDDPDSDDDGNNDGQEVNSTPPSDPLDACDPSNTVAACDRDNDGLTNGQEAALGTNPTNPDTDADGISDDDEVNATISSDPLDPCDPSNTVPACDRDNDGLTNGQEETIGTDPDDADTDKDGVLDGIDPDPLNSCVPNPNSDACPTGLGDWNYYFFLPVIDVHQDIPSSQ